MKRTQNIKIINVFFMSMHSSSQLFRINISECRADGLNLLHYFSESLEIPEMLAAPEAFILDYILMIIFYTQTIPIHITKGTGHQYWSKINLDKNSFQLYIVTFIG